MVNEKPYSLPKIVRKVCTEPCDLEKYESHKDDVCSGCLPRVPIKLEISEYSKQKGRVRGNPRGLEVRMTI